MATLSIRAGLWSLAAAAVVGCGPSLPTPTLQSVEPAEWYSGLDVELVIRGEELFPSVQVVGGEVDIDREYRIWLESPYTSLELEGVTLHSHTKLGGWARAGLDPGYYDLRVRTPAGTDTVLPEAFRATETAIKSIELSYSGSYSRRVGEIVQFEIELAGWEDERILQPLELSIVAERPDGTPADVEFFMTLSEQSELPDQDGIRGVLDEQGHATVSFRTTTPGALELEVQPIEDDSPIAYDYLGLYFEAGAVDSLDVAITPQESSYVAGDELTLDLTLLDSLGNPTDIDSDLLIQIKELCGVDTLNNTKFVTLSSSTRTSFEIQGATTEDCIGNQILAENILDSSQGGRSSVFTVDPGAPAKIEIQNTFNTIVTAGAETRPTLTLSVLDAFGNTIVDYDYDSLQFTDLDGDPLEASCSASSSAAICTLDMYRAGTATVAISDSARTFWSTSEPITVLPAMPHTVTLTTAADASNADEGRDFILQVSDEYGNVIELDESDESLAPYFSIGTTPVPCSYREATLTGDRYRCEITEADVNRVLTVGVFGLNTISNTFDVVNGALSTVSFIGPGDVKAGQSLTLTLLGEDAYGNPFIDYTTGPPNIELYDESGDVDTTVTLNSSGQATLTSLSLTSAWSENIFHAEQYNIGLGDSEPFDVIAADMDRFLIDPARGWAWVGEALSVTITAVDVFGNPITGYAGDVGLASSAGLGNTVTTDAFLLGSAEVEFTATKSGFSDSLSASDGTFTGLSALLDVVDGDCSASPTAVITIDGNDTGLACLNSGLTSPILLSASESDDAGTSLTKWYFYTEPVGWQSSTVDYISKEWNTEGAFVVSVLVVDSSACAAMASSVLYVAEDDGEPAGPISLTPASTALQCDTTDAAGETTVEIYASTCTGADASGGTVLLRTDIGTISSSALSASGSGLALSLDTKGKGTVDWSVGSQLFGGTATLYSGRSDGAAAGSVEATISGDSQLPSVIGVSPSGTFTQSTLTSTFEVAFSESILSDSVTTQTIQLTDEDGDPVAVDTLRLSESNLPLGEDVEDSVLEIELESALNLSEEVLTLTISADVTDAAGNGLDGGYSGGAEDFTLDIGDVTDSVPELIDCSLDTSRFRPDGDDGSQAESDAVELTVTATDISAWWQLEILSSGSELILLEHELSGSSSAALRWDGRSSAGNIVDNGMYTLRVAALDENWNTSATCSAAVEVDNVLE